MKNNTTLVLRQDASTNFLTPISVVDAGANVNVVIDRLTGGATGVTHSLNAVTGVGAFTLTVTRGPNVTGAGIGTLSLGSVTLSGNGTFNTGTNAGVAVTGTLGGAFGVTKLGAGSLVLSGTNSYTGATTMAGGSFVLNGSLTASSAVSVSSGLLQVAPNQMRVIKTPSLSVTGTGRLDLTDNKLILTGGAAQIGTSNGSTYTGVSRLIQTGANGGSWDGLGLVTSQGDAVAGLTTLAIATADDVGYAGGTFGGVPASAGDLLVMYTYCGDANLDGQITGDDYSSIDFSIQVPNSFGYAAGDFNYDGLVTGDDYSAIDFNLIAQGSPIPV
jgi:autotransporter-associated beta strand protein